ncbi:MAG: hypothetical protein ACRDGM_18075 [bacterium]
MPSLKEYRRAIAGELDRFDVRTTTSQGTNTTLVSSDLAEGTDLSPTALTQVWVHITSGAQLGASRQVTYAGLDAATGTLTVTPAFAGVIASGVEFELHWNMPAIRTRGIAGIRECVNRALRKMWTRDWLPIIGVTAQQKYPMQGTYPWLRRQDQIVSLREYASNPLDLNLVSGRSFDLVVQGETVLLYVPSTFNTGETFYLEVNRPANSRLRQAGVWTDQLALDAGLSIDTDEALPELNHVMAFGLCEMYLELIKRAPAEQVAVYRDQLNMWMPRVRDIKFLTLNSTPSAPRTRGVIPLGRMV